MKSNNTTEELLADLLVAILGDDARDIQKKDGNESAVGEAITTVLEWRKELDDYRRAHLP